MKNNPVFVVVVRKLTVIGQNDSCTPKKAHIVVVVIMHNNTTGGGAWDIWTNLRKPFLFYFAFTWFGIPPPLVW